MKRTKALLLALIMMSSIISSGFIGFSSVLAVEDDSIVLEATPTGGITDDVTILFNDNGFDRLSVPESITVEAESTLVLNYEEYAPILDGFVFGGWFHPDSVQVVQPGQAITVTGTGIIELFAIFNPAYTDFESVIVLDAVSSGGDDFVTILFNDNGFDGLSVPESITVEAESTLVLNYEEYAPILDGFDFGGWFHPSSVQVVQPGQAITVTGTGIIELFAIFNESDTNMSAFSIASSPNPNITNPSYDGQPVPFQTLTVRWDTVSGATSYLISLRDLSIDKLRIDRENTGTATYKTIPSSNLTAGHEFRVAVASIVGGKETWDARTFVVQGPAPTITNPSSDGQAVPFQTLTVRWGTVSGVTSYLISLRDLSIDKLRIDRENTGTITSKTISSSDLIAGHEFRVAVASVFGDVETWTVRTFSVQAAAPSYSLTLSSSAWTPGAAKESKSVSVTSNTSWTAVSSNTTWLTVTNASGSNNGSFTMNVTANTTSNSQSATVTVTGGGLTQIVNVTQTGLLAPTGLKDSATTANTFTLTWNAVSGATGYETSLDGTTWADNGVATSKKFTDLVGGTRYTAYVRAKGGPAASIPVTTANGKISGNFSYAGFVNSKSDSVATYHYDDKYFLAPSTSYNPQLSTMSLCLELSAWSSYDAPEWPSHSGNSQSHKLKNAQNLLVGNNRLGFTGFDYNTDWESAPTRDSIGVVAARKRIIDGSGKEYTLIALVVRGGGYYSEWAGNFELGADTGDEHAGFANARDKTLDFLKSYISDEKISGNIKLWIVGYSRGGAVANLAAGAINAGFVTLRGVTLLHEDLFCYTFEAPQGTQTLFNYFGTQTNIHNVVNANDIVPMYAFSAWGFKRYGTSDYLLPYLASTTRSEFDKQLTAMTEQYSKLVVDYSSSNRYRISEYTRTFGFTPSKTDFLPNGDPVTTFGIVDDMNMPQTSLLNYSVDIIARESIGSRQSYSSNIQRDLMILMEEIFNYENPGKMQELLDAITGGLVANNCEKLVHIATPTVNPLCIDKIGEVQKRLNKFLVDCAESVGIEITEPFLAAVEDVIGSFVSKNFVLFVKLVDNSTLNGNLIQAHYPEVTLAWLRSQDINYNSSATWGSAPSMYRTVKINCPVDINVYDNGDNLVASIIDDVPQYRDIVGSMTYAANDNGGDIIYSVNGNGEKVVYLPTSEAYTVDILATDTGTMTYSVTEYNAGGGAARLMNYYDVPISAGERFTGVVPAVSGDELTAALPSGSTTEYKLLDDSSAAIPISEEFTGEEITDKYFYVAVEADNDSGFIFGGGSFLKGSYAMVEAKALSAGGFIGWYAGSQLVSSDEVYRFAVMGDTQLTARFTPVERHALYLNASPGGSITSVEGLYPAGTVAAIVAEADSGYTFVNWTSSNGGIIENANTASTRVTILDGDTVLTANFAKVGGGDVDEPGLPDEGIALLPALTEQYTGNSELSGLDVDVSTTYNGTTSNAVLLGGQTIEVGISAVNTSIKIKSVQFILALHDSSGRLVDVIMQEVLIAPNGGKTVNLQIQLPQDTAGLNLRVMVWDSSSAAPHTCVTMTDK